MVVEEENSSTSEFCVKEEVGERRDYFGSLSVSIRWIRKDLRRRRLLLLCCCCAVKKDRSSDPATTKRHHSQSGHNNNSQRTLCNDLLHQFLITHHATSSIWHQRLCTSFPCQHQDSFTGCWKLIHQSSWHWIRSNSRARFHHFQGEISRGSQDWYCRIL